MATATATIKLKDGRKVSRDDLRQPDSAGIKYYPDKLQSNRDWVRGKRTELAAKGAKEQILFLRLRTPQRGCEHRPMGLFDVIPPYDECEFFVANGSVTDYTDALTNKPAPVPKSVPAPVPETPLAEAETPLAEPPLSPAAPAEPEPVVNGPALDLSDVLERVSAQVESGQPDTAAQPAVTAAVAQDVAAGLLAAADIEAAVSQGETPVGFDKVELAPETPVSAAPADVLAAVILAPETVTYYKKHLKGKKPKYTALTADELAAHTGAKYVRTEKGGQVRYELVS